MRIGEGYFLYLYPNSCNSAYVTITHVFIEMYIFNSFQMYFSFSAQATILFKEWDIDSTKGNLKL